MSICTLKKGMGSFFEPAYYLEHEFNYCSCNKQSIYVIPVLSTLDTQALKCSVSYRIKIALLVKICFFCSRNF